ncbi:MAG: M23 family metallopeptidase [Chloroflexi bacterium]|nr:MAG: M23 family metallopeptidase [Chloroflexota bacterium]
MRRLLLFIIGIVLVGGLVYLVGNLGSHQPSVRLIKTALPTFNPQPIYETYYLLDPTVLNQLDIRLNPQAFNLQPVGVYLPRMGNSQFDLTQPTAIPTLLPYPTGAPLPIPYSADNLPPTVNNADRIIPYNATTDCAPSGNPVDGVLTQRFHARHSGIDIGIPLGTPVLATHSGEVTFAGWSDVGYGYLVIVESGVFITYYAHNTSFNVSEGQLIGRGSIIAWSGSTGNSTGPHVHYEVRINNIPVDPLTFESRGFTTC